MAAPSAVPFSPIPTGFRANGQQIFRELWDMEYRVAARCVIAGDVKRARLHAEQGVAMESAWFARISAEGIQAVSA